MSLASTVEEKAVSLVFDNKDFEKNVSTSILSLGKLSDSLNLASAVNGLTEGVSTISNKFSLLGIAGVQAMERIANSAITAGTNIAKSLTIDPVKTGLSEYEEKINSVQTILMSAKNADGTAVSLDQVKSTLEELNTYADKTIYSFKDMTSNIGKFTNAGVDLDTAVAAIKGISNEAAVSGANAQNASHAMYNFAQALSAGYVKLIDWKSIENANMATVEFKEQLLDAAANAGTVKKNAEGMYEVLTKNANGGTMKQTISATENFNDSLQYQWMTTEVLTSALGKYSDEDSDIGKKAYAAAQDVKTLTQLMDTLKEAAQSGWGMTWEYIIGDYDQAKKLWTAVSKEVGGMIDAQSTARNEVLKVWAEKGGRKQLLAAISSMYKSLKSIVSAVHDAYDLVFPKTSGKQLAHMTVLFKRFVKSLAPSKEALNNVRVVARAFFNVFSLGGQIISSIIKSVKIVLVNFLGLDDVIKSAGNSAKNFVVHIAQMINKFALMNELNGTITKTTRTAMTAVKNFVFQVKAQWSGAIDRIKDSASVFSNIGSAIKKQFFPAVDETEKKVNPLITILGKLRDIVLKISEVLANLVSSGLEKLNAVNFDKIIGFLWSLLKAAGGGALTALSKGLGAVFEAIKNMNIASVFDSLESIAAIGLGSKIVENLFGNDTGSSIGDIAKGFVKSLVDGITGPLKEGMSSIKGALDEATKSLVAMQESLKASTLLKIAAAVGVLAWALSTIASIDPERLSDSAGVVTVLMGELVAAAKILGTFDKNTKSATKGLTSLAASVLILAIALKIISSCDPVTLGGSLKVVSALLAELTGVAIALAKWGGKLNGAVKGLTSMAKAVLVLAVAMKLISTIDPTQMDQSLFVLTVLLGELAGVAYALGKSGTKLSGGGVALMSMAAAVLLLSAALVVLSIIPFDKMVTGVLAVSTILLVLTACMTKMPKNMPAIAVGLLGVSAAMAVLAVVIAALGALPLKVVAQGGITIAAMLAALAIALNFMTGTIGGAAALLVAAIALNALVIPITVLGSLKLSTIVKALIALGGAIAIVGIASALLSPVLPAVLAFSGALLLIGAGIALVGVGLLSAGLGLTAIATGISALAVSLPVSIGAIITGIGEIIVGIIGLIPLIIVAISTAIKSILEALTALLPTLGTFIVTLVETVCTTLLTCVPTIGATILAILVSVLELLVDYAPKILDQVVTIILELIDTIAERIPDIVDSAFNLIISFINGLADAIVKYAPQVRDALINLAASMLDALLVFFGIHSPSTKMSEIGMNLLLGLINGIKDKVKDAKNAIVDLGKKLIAKIKEKVEDFKEAGKSLIAGLIKGIKKKLKSLISTGKGIVTDLIDAIKEKAGINSPSKVTAELGGYMGAGLVNGLKASAKSVANAGKGVANAALDSMSGVGDAINDYITADFDTTPVISPVLDTSNLQNGASKIGGLFNSQSVGLSTSISAGVVGRLMSGNLQTTNADVVTAINGLKDTINSVRPNTYNVGGVTYDDGSNISNAVNQLVNATRVARRV